MARVLADEGLIEHEGGFLEPGFDVAVRPLVTSVLAQRQLPVTSRGEILGRPLQLFDFGTRGCRCGCGGLRPAAGAGAGAAAAGGRTQTLPCVLAFGTARPQALDRIDDEGQRLVLDLNPLDRFGRRELVHRRHRQDRLTVIQRLHRQAALGLNRGRDVLAEARPGCGAGQIVNRENGLDARHRERRARVDAHHARMRHRAEQQLREQHPVGAEVFGILRLARDLRDEVRGGVVLSD